mgnify:CR=1 FL=1
MAQIKSSQEAMDLEARYGAHNYHPLPVVLAKGKGAKVWDVEGKEYYPSDGDIMFFRFNN